MTRKVLELDEALAMIPEADRVQLFEFLKLTGQENRSPASVRDTLDASLAFKEMKQIQTRN